MPSLDFISDKDKQKEGIDLLTFIATILFIGALGFDAFVGYKYYDKSQKNKELSALRVKQNSSDYQKAKAFKLVNSSITTIQNDSISIGDILNKISEATNEGVVYESIVYSEGGSTGGELKLKGVFVDAEAIKAQVEAYQEIEECLFVAYSLDSDATGKQHSLNAQGATIVIEL